MCALLLATFQTISSFNFAPCPASSLPQDTPMHPSFCQSQASIDQLPPNETFELARRLVLGHRLLQVGTSCGLVLCRQKCVVVAVVEYTAAGPQVKSGLPLIN